ncbi:hypothetical protein TWF694_000188 [Orbilia ellipsospora]|uniref:Tyrosine specific protein phosphatases domain-containing protein n=1 Tax=Orbilia ellipsospora TaxID=2528407 RepID=A0AAV9XPL6_9PEZI
MIDHATAGQTTQLLTTFHLKSFIDLRSPLEQPLPPPVQPSPRQNYHKIPYPSPDHLTRTILPRLAITRRVQLFLTPRNSTQTYLSKKYIHQPTGPKNKAHDCTHWLGPEIKDVFNVLGNRRKWPVLLYCANGADRTGMMVVLILIAVLGFEYADEIETEHRFAGVDGTDGVVGMIVEAVKRNGGIDAFLASVGVGAGQLRAIRNKLGVRNSGSDTGEDTDVKF